MKPMAFLRMALVLGLSLAAGGAQAACYADYKAKRDDPLKLHYGVIELPDAFCADQADLPGEVARRLAVENWTLLNVLSVFGDDGLEQRKESAGEFFLRY